MHASLATEMSHFNIQAKLITFEISKFSCPTLYVITSQKPQPLLFTLGLWLLQISVVQFSVVHIFKNSTNTLISLINVEVGINVEGVQYLQNQKNVEVGILQLESSPFVFK